MSAAAAQGKASAEVLASDGATVCLKLSGVIDERFDANLIQGNASSITILNLEGIKRITSFGVRQWSDAMKGLPTSVKHLYLLGCPTCFVDQLNMVLNFGGRSEVITATAIYFCDHCQDERQVPIDVFAQRAQIASGQLVAATCEVCKGPLQLEDDPQQYFRFATTYGARSIEPAAATMLENLGLYKVLSVGRPPEEVKLVHGKVTLFKISGTLDARFRPRRLATGVEGDVLFDLADVEHVEPPAGQRWRQLLDALASASSITLVEIPSSLFPAIVDKSFSVAGAIIHSVVATFRCTACQTETKEPVRSKADVAPRTCSRCGKPAPLATPLDQLTRVLEAPERSRSAPPASIVDVIGQRGELLSRARAEAGDAQRSGAAEGALSKYRVIRPISQGGMAEILLAVHQGIGGFEKLIALKKIRREMLERKHVAVELFLNEAKIAANLNHPNIVQIFEIGQHGGDLFIAMEYVHGIDGRELLQAGRKQNKPLPLELILFIGAKVAAALNAAHTARDLSGKSLNIVHRDVSLSNVVLGYDGQIKLVDFGVATASVVGASPEGLIGKVSYMSPEQIESKPLDGRSDLFSLGIVLHEMLTGVPLFRRGTDEQTLVAVLMDAIPPLTAQGVPAHVEQAVLRALARKRENRYPDGRAFELALEDCLQQMGSTVGSHDLARHLKALFGEKAAAMPVAEPDVEAEDVEISIIESDSNLLSSKQAAAAVEGTSGSKSYQMSPIPWEADDSQTILESKNPMEGMSLRDLAPVNPSEVHASARLVTTAATGGTSSARTPTSNAPAGASTAGASPTGASPIGTSPAPASTLNDAPTAIRLDPPRPPVAEASPAAVTGPASPTAEPARSSWPIILAVVFALLVAAGILYSQLS